MGLLGQTPGSVSAYLQRLEAQNEKLTLAGMGRGIPLELPMADAYVPLRTSQFRLWDEGHDEGFKGGHLEVPGDVLDNVPLSDVFQRCRAQGKRGVLLLGEPGSGKTTGGRQLAWQLASKWSGRCVARRLVGLQPA